VLGVASNKLGDQRQRVLLTDILQGRNIKTVKSKEHRIKLV
jgi:hypothetical protein